jgi:hypothetical protein
MADIIVMKAAGQQTKQEKLVAETARLLVDMSIKTLVQMYGTDCETARQFVVSASENVLAK